MKHIWNQGFLYFVTVFVLFSIGYNVSQFMKAVESE